MDPQVLKANLALALFIVLLALLVLPFQAAGSAGFVVTVLAALVGLIFVGAIAMIARWSAPRVPKADDKRGETGYNGRHPGGRSRVRGTPAKKERDDD